jgi:hypothetical protein
MSGLSREKCPERVQKAAELTMDPGIRKSGWHKSKRYI